MLLVQTAMSQEVEQKIDLLLVSIMFIVIAHLLKKGK